MKKVQLFSILAALLMFMQSCITTVDTASVGIKIDKFGDDKGVPQVQQVSGFIFYNPFVSEIHEYPANVQHKSWTASAAEDSPSDEHIDVSSSDGGRFSLDVSINYQLKREEAGNLFKKYRLDLDQLINSRFKALVRKSLIDEAVKFKSDSLLQFRNTYEGNVSANLSKQFEAEGLILNNLTITDIVAPNSYRAAIESKIKIAQQTAQAQAQLAMTEAQAKSRIVSAEADAKVIELQQSKLTPMYLEYLRIQAWEKGGAQVPQYVGGNGNFMLMPK